jgi:hypothetical protein
MSLHEIHRRYLADGARPGPLAAALAEALRAAGYLLEGSLLERLEWHYGSEARPWHERSIFVGRMPPARALPGTLWLDTVEVVAMMLLELPSHRADRPPTRAYLSLRPVVSWQFRAFVDCAQFVARSLQLQPRRPPFDGARDIPELAPTTNLLHGECLMYANWFGKRVLSHGAWRDAGVALQGAMDDLWIHASMREWAGYSGWSEEHRVIIGRDSWRIDPWDARDGQDEERASMLALDDECFPDVGFRTACPAPPDPLAGEPFLPDAMEPVPVTCASVYRR